MNKIIYISIICVVLIFTSCFKDNDIVRNQVDDCVTQKVIMTVPELNKANTQVSTRGISQIDENDIRVVDVLVFDEANKFLYKERAQRIGQTKEALFGNIKEIDLLLKKTKGTSKVNLVFLANARLNIGEFEVGTAKEDVLSTIVVSLPTDNKWPAINSKSFQQLPMWGEINSTAILGGESFSVKMIRALASISVGTNIQNGSGQSIRNFHLSTLHLYNINSKGRVAPKAGTYNSGENVTSPSLLAEESRVEEGVLYENTAQYSLFDKQIYIPEVGASTLANKEDAVCMVVGGKYFDVGAIDAIMQYYRFDFVKTNKVTGQLEPLPILRNHNYVVNIKRVSVRGYDTPEAALKGRSFNSEDGVDIEIDYEPLLGYTIFDGEYYLSVPSQTKNFESEDTFVDTLRIMTNYPDGWKAEIKNAYSYAKLLKGSGLAGGTDLIIEISNYLSEIVVSIRAGNKMKLEVKYVRKPSDAPSVFYHTLEDGSTIGCLKYREGTEIVGYWYDFANLVHYANNLQDSPPWGYVKDTPLNGSCAAIGYSVDGFYNWRLPTLKEAKRLAMATSSDILTSETSAASQDLAVTVDRYGQIGSTEKNTDGSRYVARCVRTVVSGAGGMDGIYTLSEDLFYLNSVPAIQKYIVYSNVGLSWSKGVNYDNIISSTRLTQHGVVENGYTKWVVELLPKANYADNSVVRETSIVLKSSDGKISYPVKLIQKTMPGYVITKDKTGFDYDFVVAERDILEVKNPTCDHSLLNWCSFNNKYGYVADTIIGPNGLQIMDQNGLNGASPISCAGYGEGGYEDWRVPTQEEFGNLYYHLYQQAGSSYILEKTYGLFAEEYIIANSHDLNNGSIMQGSQYSATDSYLRYIDKAMALSSNSYDYHVRCVRTKKDIYASTDNITLSPTDSKFSFRVYSVDGIKDSYKKGPNFDNVIGSISITKLSESMWSVTLNKLFATAEGTTSLTFDSKSSGKSVVVNILAKSDYHTFTKEATGLPYDIVIFGEDKTINGYDLTWFDLSNTPKYYNTLATPPMGVQTTDRVGFMGANTESCANIESGDRLWRLPTLKEIKSILSTIANPVDYGFNTDYYYITSTVVDNDPSRYFLRNLKDSSDSKEYKYNGVYGSRHRLRCVSTQKDFFANISKLTFPYQKSERKFKVFVSNGANLSYTADSNKDKVIETISFNKISEKIWEVVVKSKLNVNGGKTIVEFSAAGNSPIKVELVKTPQICTFTASETGLAYDLLMLGYDNGELDWYLAANVPKDYNSYDVPPLGKQVIDDVGYRGARPRSCADVNLGGQRWRLPTVEENIALKSFIADASDYQFCNEGYVLSETDENRSDYYLLNSFYNYNNRNYQLKSTSHPVRCVSTKGDVYTPQI